MLITRKPVNNSVKSVNNSVFGVDKRSKSRFIK